MTVLGSVDIQFTDSSSYTWMKYADDSSGNGMSDLPDGKIYIGMAYNQKTETASNVPSDYVWTLIKGADGEQGPAGVDSIRVEITSTNGNIFKNNDINTILHVRVYKGEVDITNTIAISRFRWTRVSNDSYSDNLWNQNHFSGQTAIIVTTADVKQRATFQCQLLDENLN